MPTIKISIFDGRTNQKHDMELPDNISGQQIIDAMLKNGKLPRTDSQGQLLSYDIIAGKKNAAETKITRKSLKDAGVQSGEQLILKTEIIAA